MEKAFLVKAAPASKPIAKKPVAKTGKLVIEQVEELPPAGIKLIPKADALLKYVNDPDKVDEMWTASVDGVLVGFVTIEPPHTHGMRYLQDTGYIQIIVSPKARGAGIGEALIKTALKETDTSYQYWAGFTNHSKGFKKLASKFGIRDNDDVSRYDEADPKWKKDGSYDDSYDEND